MLRTVSNPYFFFWGGGGCSRKNQRKPVPGGPGYAMMPTLVCHHALFFLHKGEHNSQKQRRPKERESLKVCAAESLHQRGAAAVAQLQNWRKVYTQNSTQPAQKTLNGEGSYLELQSFVLTVEAGWGAGGGVIWLTE